MKVKNTGNKIIGFGATYYVLPGQTIELPNSYENNEAINTFVKGGKLQIVKDATAGKKKAAKVEEPKTPVDDEVPEEPAKNNAEEQEVNDNEEQK